MNRPSVVIPLVLVVTSLGAVGQTLLRLALSRLPETGGLSSISLLLRDATFWGGGVLVGAGALTWIYVLSRAHITYAMPFLGLGFIMTMFTSALILHEPQPAMRIVGTVVMVVGLTLVASAR